jgi:hypothetical protein
MTVADQSRELLAELRNRRAAATTRLEQLIANAIGGSPVDAGEVEPLLLSLSLSLEHFEEMVRQRRPRMTASNFISGFDAT